MGSIPVGSTKKKRPHGLFFWVPLTGIPFPRDLSRRVRKFAAIRKPDEQNTSFCGKFCQDYFFLNLSVHSRRGECPRREYQKKETVWSLFFGTPDGNSVPARFIAQGAQVFGKAENLTRRIQFSLRNPPSQLSTPSLYITFSECSRRANLTKRKPNR